MMTAADWGRALREAGFAGVEVEADQVFARAKGGLEFTLTPGAPARLSLRFPLRAPDADMRIWMAANPPGRMALNQGEVELTLTLSSPDDLAAWPVLIHAAERAVAQWRRQLRPLAGM